MLWRRRWYLGEDAADNDGNGDANDDTGDDDATMDDDDIHDAGGTGDAKEATAAILIQMLLPWPWHS